MSFTIIEPIRLTFIHIPKTAGTSIAKWISDHFEYESVGRKHSTQFDLQDFNLGRTFTVVRNPWDRILSGWIHERKINPQQWDISFKDYIYKREMFSINQLDYFKEPTHVIKFENLGEEFKEIQKITNCFSPLEKLNSHSHTDYRDYYDTETKKIVEDRFNRDIEIFKYSF